MLFVCTMLFLLFIFANALSWLIDTLFVYFKYDFLFYFHFIFIFIFYFIHFLIFTIINIMIGNIYITMHLHFECQCLSTNSWTYFLDEAVIARALPRMMAAEIC